MADTSSSKRVAYSPKEFAELFGKSQTWGYRQIYAGKVTAITEFGRTLIPAKEVERVLESAGIFNGRDKPRKAKARLESLTGEQRSIWRRYVESRKGKAGDLKKHGLTAMLKGGIGKSKTTLSPTATACMRKVWKKSAGREGRVGRA